jgi:FtsH-binding integral membrane protein
MAPSHLYNKLFRKNQSGGKGNALSFFSNVKSGKFMALLEEKKSFLTLVFANLIVQLAITYFVMENSHKDADGKQVKKPISISHLVLFVIVSLVLIFIMMADIPIWAKILVFTIFSAMGGYFLSFLKYVVDPAIIQTAIAGVMGIFSSMFIFGMLLVFLGIKLSNTVGAILLLTLIAYIIINLVFVFMGNRSRVSKGLAIFGLGLFSLFVIYDTNQIMQRDYFGDFITASLDYYLEIINIFVKLIRVMEDN